MTQTPTDRVAQQVRRLREDQRLSARGLAERCSVLGAPEINRDVIANIETGRRRDISIEELLVLAMALDVSPVHLLAPDDDGDLAIGKYAVRSVPLRAWLSSRAPLPWQSQTRFAGQAIPWLRDLPDVSSDLKRAERLDRMRHELLPPLAVEAEGDADGER